MSLFKCDQCGCVENTASSRFWFRNFPNSGLNGRALCSECDPEIGKWHGRFPRQNADEAGYVPQEGTPYIARPQ